MLITGGEGDFTLPWGSTLINSGLEVVPPWKTVEKERVARETKTSDFYEPKLCRLVIETEGLASPGY